MSESSGLARPTPPTPAMLTQAENKLHQSLLTILEFLRLSPIKGTGGMSHQWAFPRTLACSACRPLETSCHLRTPSVLTVTGRPGHVSSDSLDDAPGRSDELLLLLDACERCVYLGAECRFADAAIQFSRHWYVPKWQLRADMFLVGGERAELPGTGEEEWVMLQGEVYGAVADAWEVAQRLGKVRK